MIGIGIKLPDFGSNRKTSTPATRWSSKACDRSQGRGRRSEASALPYPAFFSWHVVPPAPSGRTRHTCPEHPGLIIGSLQDGGSDPNRCLARRHRTSLSLRRRSPIYFDYAGLDLRRRPNLRNCARIPMIRIADAACTIEDGSGTMKKE